MSFLVGWALDNGRLPSEALALYNEHPRDFQLLAAMQAYRAVREKEEMDQAKQKAG